MTSHLTYDLKIGVTGHRDIPLYAVPKITQSVENVLMSFNEIGGCRAFMSSLAEGADQIAAEVANRLGYELLVPLPFERDEYISGFPVADKIKFESLETGAAGVFVVPQIEPYGMGLSRKDWLYRQAGLYVANECNVLLALWDGQPSTGSMCGTADIVEYAMSLNKTANDPQFGQWAVIQISTPRRRGQLNVKIGEIVPIVGSY